MCSNKCVKLIIGAFAVFPSSDDVTFSIDQSSGQLSVNGSLDRETLSRYLVTVNVST